MGRYVKNRYKTTRVEVETYRGHLIYRESYVEFGKMHRSDSRYHTDIVKYRSTPMLCFAKEGKPFTRAEFRYDTCRTSIEGIREMIDNVIDKGLIILTEKEGIELVKKPNRDCDWGFSYNDLVSFLEQYKKGNEKKRLIIRERLDDANFHSESSALALENYDEFLKIIEWLK